MGNKAASFNRLDCEFPTKVNITIGALVHLSDGECSRHIGHLEIGHFATGLAGSLEITADLKMLNSGSAG